MKVERLTSFAKAKIATNELKVVVTRGWISFLKDGGRRDPKMKDDAVEERRKVDWRKDLSKEGGERESRRERTKVTLATLNIFFSVCIVKGGEGAADVVAAGEEEDEEEEEEEEEEGSSLFLTGRSNFRSRTAETEAAVDTKENRKAAGTRKATLSSSLLGGRFARGRVMRDGTKKSGSHFASS